MIVGLKNLIFVFRAGNEGKDGGCLEKWHQIEKGRALTGNEIGFVMDLVMGWIEGQIR
ncbi:MAG: DUF4186 family protein [Desulfobacterales bacterium]|jgi:hypothetical protein